MPVATGSLDLCSNIQFTSSLLSDLIAALSSGASMEADMNESLCLGSETQGSPKVPAV